jgi:predicted MFS family arabinose efflux permease
MGLLETGMYIGIVIGSVLCPFLFAKLSPKPLIIIACILNACSVSVFSLTTSFWLIFASRILVGLFLSVFIIYFPVWIDQCAPPES